MFAAATAAANVFQQLALLLPLPLLPLPTKLWRQRRLLYWRCVGSMKCSGTSPPQPMGGFEWCLNHRSHFPIVAKMQACSCVSKEFQTLLQS